MTTDPMTMTTVRHRPPNVPSRRRWAVPRRPPPPARVVRRTLPRYTHSMVNTELMNEIQRHVTRVAMPAQYLGGERDMFVSPS